MMGTNVAGYELVERVARGPRATVYRGRDSARQVAVKIYDVAVESVVSIDASAHGRVRHPAIARVLDARCLASGAPCVISEWIDGIPLDALVAQDVGWPRVHALIRSINAGLAVLHAAGIVHGDLKPSNVIATRRGSHRAAIVDVGHSLVELAPEPSAYRSPEHAAGQPIDGRADLYALGAIAYELLTGEQPGNSAVPPSQRAPDRSIPRAADDLCTWLLADDPDARLPSTRVLAVTLGALAFEHGALSGATVLEEGRR